MSVGKGLNRQEERINQQVDHQSSQDHQQDTCLIIIKDVNTTIDSTNGTNSFINQESINSAVIKDVTYSINRKATSNNSNHAAIRSIINRSHHLIVQQQHRHDQLGRYQVPTNHHPGEAIQPRPTTGHQYHQLRRQLESQRVNRGLSVQQRLLMTVDNQVILQGAPTDNSDTIVSITTRVSTVKTSSRDSTTVTSKVNEAAKISRKPCNPHSTNSKESTEAARIINRKVNTINNTSVATI
ncbi:hypothetical protein BDK51DRAFT_35365 [Blyttiomyces helicus]|uniref:Uncharacterized protein n=1 Tax=Blyttiomyces helicus TaxID=388810 RepID=A0A4P9WNC0_9FUNG|nr:hypothetical protein BDK51DRAFT_35365 [Blyttiomyces helicus]|eukprot:RKO93765.1 hypothetical protein BDK51DRAFT_35365 [Blyttiomyces helicus]